MKPRALHFNRLINPLSVLALALVLGAAGASAAEPSPDDILATMKKATAFMSEQVALNGGYVWVVSPDFSRRWGEVPARPSQIWLQGGTESVGEVMLDAYEATGDEAFLDVARKAADAIVYGQLPTGGWHYFIDFSPPGLNGWYENVASRFLFGYEEYRHYYGNATFDDRVTQDAARFLLRFYNLTLEAAYRAPVLEALDFIVESQFPNGAWPQRFPLHQDPSDDRPDYPSLYTLNDGAMQANIELLLDAHSTLGDPRYFDSAKHGVDALVALQGPEGQGGWAEQFGPDMQPAAARTHEPPGYVVRESIGVVDVLTRFYLLTGDRRYLAPIPRAFDWFDRINRESTAEQYPKPRYWEPGTNRPLYVVATDEVFPSGHGKFIWTTDPSQTRCDDGPCEGDGKPVVDVAPLRARHVEVAALTTPQARTDYLDAMLAAETAARAARQIDRDESTSDIIAAMDARGAWVTDDIRVTRPNADTGEKDHMETVRGISTRVFVDRITTLISALRADNGV